MERPLMRKTNLKVLLAVLGGTIVLAGVLFGVHYLQRQRIASALLWQARKAEEANQVDRTIRFLGRYLDFRPDDLDEKARLGRTLLSETAASSPAARSRAVDLLDAVLRQQPERSDDRRTLVKGALTLSNRTKLARESLTLLLDPNKPEQVKMSPEDLGELEGFWGAVFEQEGQYRDAIAWCRKAIKNRPDEQVNYLRVAYLLRRQVTDDVQQREANEAEANQVIDALVEQNASSAEAYLARWRYRREFDLVQVTGKVAGRLAVPFEEAGKDIREALKLAPENLDILLAAADVERLQNDRKTAREHLRRAEESLARQGRTSPNDYHVQQVKWQLANLLLDEALLQRTDVAARDANLKEALPAVEALRKSMAMRGAADYLDGRLCFQRGQWTEATRFLEKARTVLHEKRDLVAQIDLFLGQCYEKLDEPARMGEAFKRLTEYDANSIAGQVGMASALWMQGRLDDALRAYALLIRQKRVPSGVWQDIARLQLARQLQIEPAKRNWSDAEAALANAEKDQPRSVEVNQLRIEMLAAQGKYAEAEEQVARALQEKPKEEAELWVLRADLARRQNQMEKARAILDQATEALGDSVPLRLARVQVALSDPLAATKALAQAEQGLTKFSPEEQAELLQGLAGASLRLGRTDEARRLTTQLARTSMHRHDPRLQLLLLDMALRAGDSAAVEQTLETMRSQEQGSGPYTRFGMAQISLAQARKLAGNDPQRESALEEARRQLDLVAVKRPSWAPVHTARAELFEIQGQLEQAITELRQAMREGDRSPAVVQRLVRALMQRQRDNEADEELKKLQGSVIASSSELGKLVASVALKKGDPARALDLARAAVAVDSADFGDQIWMARMQAAAGKFAEAEMGLRKATTLAPKSPEPWVALVQFLALRDRHKDAEAVLTEAEGKVEANRRAVMRALSLEALGKLPEAGESIRQAEKAEPDNIIVVRHAVRFYLRAGDLDNAEVSLRRVLQGKVSSAKTEDRDWARRGLALTLANGNDFKRFREALDLVGLALDEKGRLPRDNPKERINTEMLRTQARVLATQPQLSYRGRAIDLFERLDRSQTLNDEDRLMLAMLLDRSGNWPRAAEQYRQVALRPKVGPQPLVQYALGLIRQKDLPLAEEIITRIEALEKERKTPTGTYGTQELRSRVLEARGNIDGAYDLLKKHVERAKANPEEQLALVAFSSRYNRLDEGLRVCIAARKACKPEAVSGATVALLRVCKASDAQCQEAQDWLRKAITDNPGKLVLRMHLANLFDYRGLYREAEEQYRELLKAENEPNNIVAMNNLAWLLALQPGKGAEALDIVTQAIQKAGRRPELLDTRGTILLNLGQTAEALVDLKEVATDAPTALRLFHLARAYHANKERDNATRTLRKAKDLGLKIEDMHPVEREVCKKMMSELRL